MIGNGTLYAIDEITKQKKIRHIQLTINTNNIMLTPPYHYNPCLLFCTLMVTLMSRNVHDIFSTLFLALLLDREKCDIVILSEHKLKCENKNIPRYSS